MFTTITAVDAIHALESFFHQLPKNKRVGSQNRHHLHEKLGLQKILQSSVC